MTELNPAANPSSEHENASRPTQSKYCPGCGVVLHKDAPQCPQCGLPQPDMVAKATGAKSRVIAIVLALLVGSIGVHKFYLGRIGMGILYLVFCWTFVPAIIAFVEAIIYVTMTDEAFTKKYG
jgi:TM2 domain-containing membrane protein YozV